MVINAITSTFNGGQYLTACLESIFQETKANPKLCVEHIVVDAASKDDSIAILTNWARQHANSVANYKFRWVSEPDNGQSDGFNKGVLMASGEWVCWLNADDELAPGALQAFSQALKGDAKADVIYGHIQFIDGQSRPVKQCYHLPYRYSLIRNNVYVPPTSGSFFSRQLLIDQPLNCSYHYVMDVEWFLRCGERLNAVLSDHIFSRFRISTQGKTSEMIVSGQITERHLEERERYRQKYIYSQWSNLTPEQARYKLARHQRLYKLYYYWLKVRYSHRYIADRFFHFRTASPKL